MKTTQIVVRVTANHPTGVRRRCGFIFGHKPCLVEVTKEELKVIQEDAYLAIVDKGLALEDGKKNVQKRPGEEGDDGEDGKGEDDEEDEAGDEELTVEKLMEHTKPQLQELAVTAGAVKGEDFTDDTVKKDLAELVISKTKTQE